MLTLLLCIIFSKTLTFSGFTVMAFLTWLNNHPFICLIFIIELFYDLIKISQQK